MGAVFGTYRGGHIILDSSVDWPEGSRVAISPATVVAGVGLAEADWPDSPETRAILLARLDALEPFEMTEQDDAEIASAREAIRQASLQAVRRRMGLTP